MSKIFVFGALLNIDYKDIYECFPAVEQLSLIILALRKYHPHEWESLIDSSSLSDGRSNH